MLRTRPRRVQTYMITAEDPEDVVLAAVERALRRGVDLVQLRRRPASARALERLAATCLERFAGLSERLLVNDRLDVALSVGAAGVHLPAAGLPAAAVRRAAPEGFRIGVSTHIAEEVQRAERDGASFVAFGPVFPTASKPGHPGVGIEALAAVVRASKIPVFALGGVGPDSLADVVATGVAGVAGISMFRDESEHSRLASALVRGGGE